MSIARLQSYVVSGSKTRHSGISEILPIITIIDTGYSCAEKTIMEARCSPIYYDIFMLTWTESDINAPICLSSGSRVRITADRKDRYTLLPEFPFLIILKLKMAVFLKVSFRSFNIYIRFALHTDSGFSRKRKRQRDRYQSFSFPEGTTSLHTEYKVACVCRCSMQCLLSILWFRYTVDLQKFLQHQTLYIYIYIYLA